MFWLLYCIAKFSINDIALFQYKQLHSLDFMSFKKKSIIAFYSCQVSEIKILKFCTRNNWLLFSALKPEIFAQYCLKKKLEKSRKKHLICFHKTLFSFHFIVITLNIKLSHSRLLFLFLLASSRV